MRRKKRVVVHFGRLAAAGAHAETIASAILMKLRTIAPLLLCIGLIETANVVNAAEHTSTLSTPPVLTGSSGEFIHHENPVAVSGLDFFDELGTPINVTRFSGKIVMINLWATWCPPCVKEMPSLDRLQGAFDPSDFEVVAICNSCGDVAEIRRFLKQQHIERLTLYYHPELQVIRSLGARGLPTTILLSREGTELGRLAGDAEWDSPEAIAVVRYYLTSR